MVFLGSQWEKLGNPQIVEGPVAQMLRGSGGKINILGCLTIATPHQANAQGPNARFGTPAARFRGIQATGNCELRKNRGYSRKNQHTSA